MSEKITTICDLYPDTEFMKADGFDDAIIGILYSDEKLVYSVTKIIDILIKNNPMTKEDAMEHFEFNIGNAYVGEKTPIFVDDLMIV